LSLYPAGVVPRTYTPVAHEDDLFLPTRHMGSKEVRGCAKDDVTALWARAPEIRIKKNSPYLSLQRMM
jgi:hypothetical protein